MSNTNFFDEVEKITLHEPLADFLGASKESIFSYEDCVKLSGHSCPTVAGAYLMALCGLKYLYKNKTPIRGDIKVEFRESKESGVVGVIANVLSFITGARQNDGFKGLGGKFNRNNLLFFDTPITAEVRLSRIDTLESIEMSYALSSLFLPALDNALMQKALMGNASQEEQNHFKIQWQRRVKEILLVHNHKAIYLH